VSDDRAIAYLRSRGQVRPPADLVTRVMAAVEAAPPARSPFAAFLPAAIVAGAVAIIAALAVILGQGPNVGPQSTEAPSAAPAPASIVELREALAAGLEALRDAPGVEGRTTASVLGELSGATWFSWRPGGDQVVIGLTDVDVAESGWWMDPASTPPARGRNVSTSIHVFIADVAYVTDGDEWAVEDRADAPPAVSIATGLLDGELDAGMMPLGPEGEVTVTRAADGAATWSLTGPYRDGIGTAEWQLAADGTLRSWSYELSDVTPSVEDAPFVTSSLTEFTPLVDPEPIEAPDTDSPPDPRSLGLPPNFPFDQAD
jgi:hypothetical protein